MKLSFIYLTYRPGGIDLLGKSLELQKDVDYELIVVDDYPGRVEREKAMNFLLEKNIPIRYYGPSKPKQYSQTRHGLTNAMNSGALYATGDWVLFCHDFILLSADFILLWQKAIENLKEKTLLHGVGSMYDAPEPSEMNDITVWADKKEIEFRNKWIWVPDEFELFNMGVPVDFITKINGFDERADCGGSFLLRSIMGQAKMHDYKLKVDHSLVSHMIDHRVWDRTTGSDDSLWRIRGHFSQLAGEPLWEPISKNLFFDFNKEREKICQS